MAEPVVRLRALGGRHSDRPVWTFEPITWAECDQGCGATAPYSTPDETGAVFDFEPVVCPDCGAVGHTSVDGEAGDAWVVWGDDALTDAALAGFRRLVGLPRAGRVS